jgi:hypothetical protein
MDPWTDSVIRATLPASLALIFTGVVLHFTGDLRGKWLVVAGTLGLLGLVLTDNLGVSYELLTTSPVPIPVHDDVHR